MTPGKLTRRKFIQGAGTASATILLGSALVDCGGDDAGGQAGTGGTTGAGGSAGAGTGGSTSGTSVGAGGSTGAGGTSAAGGTTGAGGSATGSGGTTTKASSGAGGTTAAQSSTVATGSALVGIVGTAAGVEQAVRDAVAMVGGLPDLSGKCVLLKPNLNSGDPIPYSTGPDVMSAVIKQVAEKGATRIIVGDRSNPSFDTMDAMTRSGIAAVVTTLKGQGLPVESMNLGTQPTVAVAPAGSTHWASGYHTYQLLTDGTVDYIINCCCCKNHTLANFTMAMKAWMGIIVQADRNTAHSDLGNRLPELHLAVKEDFVIMDATQICLTNGPQPNGRNVIAAPNLVVASKDPVANDVTGLCILRHYLALTGTPNTQLTNPASIWSQPQIVRALALNNGWITSKQQYTLDHFQAKGVADITAMMQYLTA